MSLLRVLVSLGRIFHRLPRQLVRGPMIFLAVVRCGDAVSMRSKIVELGGSLVPVVSALPVVIASVTSVAHESLLHGIKQKRNRTMPDLRAGVPHSDGSGGFHGSPAPPGQAALTTFR